MLPTSSRIDGENMAYVRPTSLAIIDNHSCPPSYHCRFQEWSNVTTLSCLFVQWCTVRYMASYWAIWCSPFFCSNDDLVRYHPHCSRWSCLEEWYKHSHRKLNFESLHCNGDYYDLIPVRLTYHFWFSFLTLHESRGYLGVMVDYSTPVVYTYMEKYEVSATCKCQLLVVFHTDIQYDSLFFFLGQNQA